MRPVNYYPSCNNPIHEVKDWCKVRKMIRALRRGESLPTVYVDGPMGSGNWLSGTHRVAASEIRAMLDGTTPYEDLDIINIGDKLAQLYDSNDDATSWGYDDQLEAIGLSGE